MSRIFAYLRVSTTEQTTENQLQAIKQAGYDIKPSRVVAETVSGSTCASQRKGFQSLLNKLEEGDSLVVLKLDRLGRDNIDVQQTIQSLIEAGIKPICLDLPVKDLSSAEGKLVLQLFSTFAEFERNRLIERTKEGIERAKSEGKKLGRPEARETHASVQRCKNQQKMSQSQTAGALGISLSTVKRHWNTA